MVGAKGLDARIASLPTGGFRGDLSMTDRIGDVHIAREGHVASVTIRKPPNNSVSVDLMRDLADALEGLGKEKDVRAVVLATEGKVFCAGADLSKRASEVGLDSPTSNPLY